MVKVRSIKGYLLRDWERIPWLIFYFTIIYDAIV
jgi:hypothetical protein